MPMLQVVAPLQQTVSVMASGWGASLKRGRHTVVDQVKLFLGYVCNDHVLPLGSPEVK